MSAVTKYTGGLCVKFLTTLKNFLGKLLYTVFHDMSSFQWAMDLDGSLNHTQAEDLTMIMSAMSFVHMHQCEVLVLATVFWSVVPGRRLEGGFPPHSDWYAATENPSVHYVGWLVHRGNVRRGAGGFLSGFRYLIRNIVHHAREKNHSIPSPHLKFIKKNRFWSMQSTYFRLQLI